MVDCTMSKFLLCSRAIPTFKTTCCMQMINFSEKYFHKTIFFIEFLCLRAIPFWTHKYASRTLLHFAMRPLFVFFVCWWLFVCFVDLRSFVSVVMFFFDASVVFITLLKMKILVNVWNWFFRWPNLCPHTQPTLPSWSMPVRMRT